MFLRIIVTYCLLVEPSHHITQLDAFNHLYKSKCQSEQNFSSYIQCLDKLFGCYIIRLEIMMYATFPYKLKQPLYTKRKLQIPKKLKITLFLWCKLKETESVKPARKELDRSRPYENAT